MVNDVKKINDSIRTKIICTIGPAVNTYEKITALIEAGMNVARINFSHGTYEEHKKIIDSLKKARENLNVPLAIMLDTKGPEVRIGKVEEGAIKLYEGSELTLTKEDVIGDGLMVAIYPASVIDQVDVGATILFDDGYISSEVIEKTENTLKVRIENSGILKGGKGVNFPYTCLNLPPLTEKDLADIIFGCEQNVDYIAASFVRAAEDILQIKQVLSENGQKDCLVLAKIENHEGVENIDTIIQVADGIMIARGDLGVEVPLTKVPKLQKMMIRKCYLAGKPAVTATQMLESMIRNPRPTRAEASDVANAIYDSTSAVMLSGETAIGNYPIETVKLMKSIVKEAEDDFDFRNFFNLYAQIAYNDVPSAVTLAAVKTAYSCNAKAIFAFTSSGHTAKLLSRLRPQLRIFAATSNEKCYHQMALNWGVIPIMQSDCDEFYEAFRHLGDFALDHNFVKYGDLVIATVGQPFGVPNTTNTMIVESIGDVLVRGGAALGNTVHGKVHLIHSVESTSPYSVKDKLLVVAKCDEEYLPLIKECAGIILQNHPDDLDSETYVMQQARNLRKSTIVRAENAFNVLNEGQLVTMDTHKAIVYKGVILNIK